MIKKEISVYIIAMKNICLKKTNIYVEKIYIVNKFCNFSKDDIVLMPFQKTILSRIIYMP